MIPENIHEFLLASAGASATFIGLLFVALTLVLGRLPQGSSLALRERTLAESSYTALITIFFLSMAGLLPEANVSWAMVAIGWLGTASSLRLVRDRGGLRRVSRTLASSLTSLYLALSIFGLYEALMHEGTLDTGVFIAFIFAFYAVALARAWSLIGVDQGPKS